MFSLRRFHREDVTALRAGDFVRFNVLHQSRTGMIVRLRFRGRITEIKPVRVLPDSAPSAVAGLLTDRHGIVQGFTLSITDTVHKMTELRRPLDVPGVSPQSEHLPARPDQLLRE